MFWTIPGKYYIFNMLLINTMNRLICIFVYFKIIIFSDRYGIETLNFENSSIQENLKENVKCILWLQSIQYNVSIILFDIENIKKG